MSYHIDYSDSDTDSSNSDDCNEELLNIKERPLTPSLLKTHEKKFENGLYMDDCNDVNITENREIHDYCEDNNYLKHVKEQIISMNNEMMLRDLAHNIEMLKQMHEDICERLDWVTQQTQIIADNFNEDRKEGKRERRKDRAQDLFFSFIGLLFFVIGILYATVLFVLEMYYSVNFIFF